MASDEQELSRHRLVAERGKQSRELCGATRHDGVVDEFGPGKSERVSIRTRRRTSTEERGDHEAGVNGHGSHEELR